MEFQYYQAAINDARNSLLSVVLAILHFLKVSLVLIRISQTAHIRKPHTCV